MNRTIRITFTLALAAFMAAALGACSSSSSPTEAEGISSLRGIEGAFDETGNEGIHPDDWDDNHQDTPQGELGNCIACHVDTAVDEEGCLPCHHTEAAGGEEDGDARNPHDDEWEIEHQSQADFGSCLPCHADTAVDEEGCLPCHTDSDDEEDDQEDEEENEEEEGEEEDEEEDD